MEPISVDEFPSIELGGKTYQLKFTRGALFRLDDAGISFNPAFTPAGYSIKLANLIRTLHIVIGFAGTHEELAELAFDRRNEIGALLVQAWGKVLLPSLQLRTSALAVANPEEVKPTLQ